MLLKFRVDNFRCFQEFELDLTDCPTAVLIGRNGSGKSTVRHALGVLQTLCQKSGDLGEALNEHDFGFAGRTAPMTFEATLNFSGHVVKYALTVDMPERFRKPKVVTESMSFDDNEVFYRTEARVRLPSGAMFSLDWHIAALKVIDSPVHENALGLSRQFLREMVLILPITSLMRGVSTNPTMAALSPEADNFAEWFTDLVGTYPASYPKITDYLIELMPDFRSFENAPRGETTRQIVLHFGHETNKKTIPLEFERLSDGEKCFVLSAAIQAAIRVRRPVFCFWDEPDNHLSLSEVGHFVTALKSTIHSGGQFLVTSHHPETIRQFTDESTFVFRRKSHLHASSICKLSAVGYKGELVDEIQYGDVLVEEAN